MIHQDKKNNDVLEPVGRSAITFLLLAACAVCAIIHLCGIGGDFLSDDFAHAGWIAAASDKGELLWWLVQRLYLPLDSGNFAYRPVVFASYALDWIFFGNTAQGWHATNLVIHLLNTVLMLVLANRLAVRVGCLDARFAAMAVAIVFVAIPFAGESTFWPVGRFDLLACTFSISFLVLLVGSDERPGAPRTMALLASLLLALLSKESAMPMLAVGFALVFVFSYTLRRTNGLTHGALLTAATKETFARYWLVLAVALAYFAWRYWIFGSPWKVYPDSHFPSNISEFWMRISALEFVFVYPYAEYAAIWWVLIALAGTVWLAGLTLAARIASSAAIALAIVLFGCFLMYLLAPATSFAVASSNGEGIRNLYFPWAMFSLFAGFAIAYHRTRLALLCVLLLMAFWGQWRLVTLWHDAASQMLRVTAAVPALADTIGESQYALLLLPDHVGAAPFVRNAQGGVVMPPRQRISYLPKMAAMTPLQFAEWEQHLADNTIGSLKDPHVAFDRASLVGVYCWVPSRDRFQRLNARPRVDDPKSWEAETMQEAKSAGCLLSDASVMTAAK